MSIKLEGTRIDINWYDRENGILRAKIYRGKKKNSGVKFKIKTETLNGVAECKNCPFKTNTYLCGKTDAHVAYSFWNTFFLLYG